MKERDGYQEEYRLIGGRQQYLLHYPARGDAPLLLFLHGGPGVAESNLGYLYRKWWGEAFSAVYWDQPAAGKTYLKNKGAPEPDIGQVQSDLHEVVQYLKARYGKEKICLLGHSWGTVLGSLYALRHPENIALYVGVGQVVSLRENEAYAYRILEKAIRSAGNKKDAEKLEKLGSYPPADMHTDAFMRQMRVFRKLLGKYGLLMRIDMALVRAYIQSPVMRGRDAAVLLGNMQKKSARLLDWLMDFDLPADGHEYEMPICYILGRNDFQAVTPLAEEYFEGIIAPKKQIHIIDNAGHNTMFDQPQAFASALAEARKML